MADALIPSSWYSDQAILDLELDLLFRAGPGYVGHELSVPEVGDRAPVDLDGRKLVLVRGERGPEVLVNACRHRQAVLVEEPGNGKHIQCPFHKWTYGLDGTLVAAPRFPVSPCRNLLKIPSSVWNGLVLAGPAPVGRDLARWGQGSVFDFAGHSWHSAVDAQCQQNWKTFVEVYLDLYHVAPFHPGLAGMVSCDDLRWTMGELFSVQTVGVKGDLIRAATPAYEAWQAKVLEAYGGSAPAHGAIWLFYYPNLMLEWNPGAIVISHLRPVTPSLTVNRIEFFYRTSVLESVPGYAEAHQAAYFETAAEDERLGRMMDAGRAGLIAGGLEDLGPIQSPLEDGITHFHKYVLDRLR